MQCPRCQRENRPDANFCDECGGRLGGLAASTPSYAEMQAEIDRLSRSLAEGGEEQAATREILRVISNSPNDIQPVFETIMQSAASLCNARNGAVLHFDGEKLHFVASTGWQNVDEIRRLYPRQPDPETLAGRVILEGVVVHIKDFETDQRISEVVRRATLALGVRSALGVPMVQRGKIIGAITLGKLLPEPFTTKHIALLQTFAD